MRGELPHVRRRAGNLIVHLGPPTVRDWRCVVRTRRAGDGEFERFVLEAYPGLVRFGALLVGGRAGGEDVTQAALIKVHGAWHRIDDKAAAGAYTRTAMVRLAAQWGRRRWHGERPTAIDADAVSALDRTAEVAVGDAVRRALAALPLDQRAVLVLRYYEDRSEEEIARLLGIAPGTVKSRASRGLAAMRELGLVGEGEPAEERR
jgi:RNA polymerase sigma-70 factor (sigma-E family)